MTQQKTLLTADEFYEFCCRNDGRYELVDGKVVEMASGKRRTWHRRIEYRDRV